MGLKDIKNRVFPLLRGNEAWSTFLDVVIQQSGTALFTYLKENDAAEQFVIALTDYDTGAKPADGVEIPEGYYYLTTENQTTPIQVSTYEYPWNCPTEPATLTRINFNPDSIQSLFRNLIGQKRFDIVSYYTLCKAAYISGVDLSDIDWKWTNGNNLFSKEYRTSNFELVDDIADQSVTIATDLIGLTQYDDFVDELSVEYYDQQEHPHSSLLCPVLGYSNGLITVDCTVNDVGAIFRNPNYTPFVIKIFRQLASHKYGEGSTISIGVDNPSTEEEEIFNEWVEDSIPGNVLDDNVIYSFYVQPYQILSPAAGGVFGVNAAGNDNVSVQLPSIAWASFSINGSPVVSGDAYQAPFTITITIDAQQAAAITDRSSILTLRGEYSGLTVSVNILQKAWETKPVTVNGVRQENLEATEDSYEFTANIFTGYYWKMTARYYYNDTASSAWLGTGYIWTGINLQGGSAILGQGIADVKVTVPKWVTNSIQKSEKFRHVEFKVEYYTDPEYDNHVVVGGENLVDVYTTVHQQASVYHDSSLSVVRLSTSAGVWVWYMNEYHTTRFSGSISDDGVSWSYVDISNVPNGYTITAVTSYQARTPEINLQISNVDGTQAHGGAKYFSVGPVLNDSGAAKTFRIKQNSSTVDSNTVIYYRISKENAPGIVESSFSTSTMNKDIIMSNKCGWDFYKSSQLVWNIGEFVRIECPDVVSVLLLDGNSDKIVAQGGTSLETVLKGYAYRIAYIIEENETPQVSTVEVTRSGRMSLIDCAGDYRIVLGLAVSPATMNTLKWGFQLSSELLQEPSDSNHSFPTLSLTSSEDADFERIVSAEGFYQDFLRITGQTRESLKSNKIELTPAFHAICCQDGIPSDLSYMLSYWYLSRGDRSTSGRGGTTNINFSQPPYVVHALSYQLTYDEYNSITSFSTSGFSGQSITNGINLYAMSSNTAESQFINIIKNKLIGKEPTYIKYDNLQATFVSP